MTVSQRQSALVLGQRSRGWWRVTGAKVVGDKGIACTKKINDTKLALYVFLLPWSHDIIVSKTTNTVVLVTVANSYYSLCQTLWFAPRSIKYSMWAQNLLPSLLQPALCPTFDHAPLISFVIIRPAGHGAMLLVNKHNSICVFLVGAATVRRMCHYVLSRLFHRRKLWLRSCDKIVCSPKLCSQHVAA